MAKMHPIKIRLFAVAGLFLVLQASESAEWIKVRLGDTVLLGCNISYHAETIWMRQNIDQIPTVVLISGPNRHDGEVFSKKPLSARFTAVPNAQDKTNQLRITNVTAADLALYYCVGRILGMPQFGKGTRLHRVLDKEHHDSGREAESQEKEQGVISLFNFPSFHICYAAVLGLGQLGMICAVFTVHLRSRGASNPEKAPRPPRRRHTVAN
ncbi:uncharacterized protein LOC118226694 isoform X1 [Anguilla anguilla]|uniref:uncharacterized protein LOC118226694 isoform X1 n=1 Tax=Anguilla anguilla TaxID=7936 RepID=UPI0015A9C7E1|nr:uncharacterized protein LOC118226694 isoform X1 [Anguilla anguilla]